MAPDLLLAIGSLIGFFLGGCLFGAATNIQYNEPLIFAMMGLASGAFGAVCLAYLIIP